MLYPQQNPGTSTRVFDLWLNLETFIFIINMYYSVKNFARKGKGQKGQKEQSAM